MAVEIDNPADFILQHGLAPENLLISEVDVVLVDSEEVWNKATSPCVSDDHYESLVLRFRYTYADRQNGLLMIQQDGQVCTNGERCQKDTFFKVLHNFSDMSYQIICIHGINQNKILYMDGVYLRTRVYNHGSDDNNPDTLFDFVVKGDNSWEITARTTGHVLKFDTVTGMYLPPDDTDQVDSPAFFCNPDIGPGFKAYMPTKMKVTTV